MKVFVVLFLSILLSGSLFGQTVMDTIQSPDGDILIYSDQTWEYLEDVDFDGVMNETVHEYFENHPEIKVEMPWENDRCYASNLTNNLSGLKDTLWLCVTDTAYANFALPHPGKVASKYGYRYKRYHKGIDISLNTGDTIVAAFDGKVRYSKYNRGGFGNLVVIRHFNGLETFYAHMSKLLVSPNSRVKAGDPIGLGGSTGRSFGAHLHFETRFYDVPINPEEIIDFENGELRNENLFVHKGVLRPGAPPSHTEQFENYTAKTFYRIKSGDTLSRIAQRNHTTIARLCQLNNISRNSTLHIGQQIQVR